MDAKNNICTACFPDGGRPQCRVFDHSSGALTVYSGLHAAGKLPAMCLQADQRYRVCHLPETSLNSLRTPATRAA